MNGSQSNYWDILLGKAKTFTREELLDIIEYIDSFPNNFKIPFLTNFKKDFDRIAGNGKRVLYTNSSIHRYMSVNPLDSMKDEKNFEFTSYPDESTYQKKYSSIIKEINDTKTFTQSSKTALIKIMNSPCYELDHFKQIEKIAHTYASVAYDKESKDISAIYIEKILPFKAAAFDFFFNLVLKYCLSDLKYTADISMNKIVASIIDALNLPPKNDKYIFLAARVNMFNSIIGTSKDYLSKGYDIHIINILQLHNENPTEFLYNMGAFQKGNNPEVSIFKSVNNYYLSDNIRTEDNNTFKTIDGYIFTSKDISDFEDYLNHIINISNDNNLKAYLPNGDSIDPSRVQFSLSENDIGHLQYLKNDPKILTLISRNDDKFTSKTFLKLSNDIYIIFKIEYNDNTLYGVSVEPMDNDDRKVITITLNPNVSYEF